MVSANMISIALAAALTLAHAHAQPGPHRTTLVSGRVTMSTGSPISTALVILVKATGNEEITFSRTRHAGRFIYAGTPGMSYELIVQAPGFRTRTIQLRTSASSMDLKDIVLQTGPESANFKNTRAARIISQAQIPQELLARISKDLEPWSIESCLRDEDKSLEDSIRPTWFTISTQNVRALLVEGLGSCTSGANNGAQLIYAEFAGTWRKIFDEIGNRLNPLSTTTHGFYDIERWQHGSAFESARYVYQFNGKEYAPVRCENVEFGNSLSAEPYPKPKYTPCADGWKDSAR